MGPRRAPLRSAQADELPGCHGYSLVFDYDPHTAIGKVCLGILHPDLFVLCALCGLAWPYNALLELVSFRCTWNLRKVVSIGDLATELVQVYSGKLAGSNRTAWTNA